MFKSMFMSKGICPSSRLKEIGRGLLAPIFYDKEGNKMETQNKTPTEVLNEEFEDVLDIPPPSVVKEDTEIDHLPFAFQKPKEA